MSWEQSTTFWLSLGTDPQGETHTLHHHQSQRPATRKIICLRGGTATIVLLSEHSIKPTPNGLYPYIISIFIKKLLFFNRWWLTQGLTTGQSAEINRVWNGTSILYYFLPRLRDYFGKEAGKLSELEAVGNYKERVFSGHNRVVTQRNTQQLWQNAEDLP